MAKGAEENLPALSVKSVLGKDGGIESKEETWDSNGSWVITALASRRLWSDGDDDDDNGNDVETP